MHETWHTTHLVYIILLKLLELIIIVIFLKLSVKLRFKCFEGFVSLSRIKKLKLGLLCTKLSTQHNLVYIIVLKLLESIIIVICLKLSVKLRFKCFEGFLALSHIKKLKFGLLCTKLSTQHYLVYIIVFNW